MGDKKSFAIGVGCSLTLFILALLYLQSSSNARIAGLQFKNTQAQPHLQVTESLARQQPSNTSADDNTRRSDTTSAREPSKYEGAPPSDAKFVYYKCGPECDTQGMVDRLRGVLFAYLLAVALDRHFAMDINLPCFDDMLTENQIKWKTSRELAAKAAKELGEETWYFNIGTDGAQFVGKTIFEKAGEKGTLYVSQNAMAFTPLARNPINDAGSRVLKEMGTKNPIGVTFRTTAQNIFWRLFALTPLAQEEIAKVLNPSQYQQSGSSLICAHFRQEIEQTNDVPAIVQAMRSRGLEFKDPVFFVASDRKENVNQARKLCEGCKFLEIPQWRIGHTAFLRSNAKADKDRCEITKRALLELLLLSKCDVYYMTANSGFSILPHFIRQNYTQFSRLMANTWYRDV